MDRIVNDDVPSIENNEQEIKKDFLSRMFKIISKHNVEFEIAKSIRKFVARGYTPDEAKQETRNEYRQTLQQDNDIVKSIINNSGEDIYCLYLLSDYTVVKENEADRIEECRRLHIECISDIFCKYDFTIVDDEIIAGKEIVREMYEVYLAYEIVQRLNREIELGITLPSDNLNKYLSTDETLQMIQQLQQELKIPPKVLTWLQQTICANGKTYIESATGRPLKWLQNKQLARELLTHDKIKGDLTDAEVKQQALKLFIHHKDNEPLLLAKPKKVPSSDSDKLSDYLATLQPTDS